ncbi:MAG: Ig-like domain-containing protein [Paludibacteraceae bacterium]|nr:Ig-like domain-containing protein [Paludibacteraceae bacterium]
MKNTFQKLSLWRLITVVISVCFTASLYAQSPTASFTYDDMATQGGVSITTDGITGKKASTNFCKDGGTQIKADLISLDQSAGTSPDTKHILIESSSDITSISLDASYNSSGSAKNIAIACWKDGNSDISSPDYIYTVGILGYDRDCSAALVTQAIGEGVRTIRIYRKVKFSGTDYGAGTTTNFKEIQVFAGAPCADAKPTISGALSPCGSTTTLSVSGQTAGASLLWYKDGVAIAGETSGLLTVTANGDYKVVATKNCAVSSDPVTVSLNATMPSAPTITQSGNTVTISGTGGDVKYSLDGGSSWVTGTSVSITQDEVIKAKVENACYSSDIVTYNATWTLGPTCAYIGSGAGTLDATTPYDFGDFRMYHGGNKDDNYNTSTSNICGDAAKRYYMDYIIVELEGYGASQINIAGHGGGSRTATVEIADAFAGPYSALSSGSITSSIDNSCGEIAIPGIVAKQGKFVKITFSGEVRVSGVCVTPLPCDAPTISGETYTIYNCGTKNNVQLSLTEFAPGDGSTVGTWSSSDESIATVNASGKVTAVAPGQVNIIFTPTNTDFCPAKKTITVSQVTVSGPEEVGEGKSVTLTPSLTGGTWSSNRTGVATVTGGVVTGVAGGTATITYTVNGCPVTHDVTVLPNLSVITPPVLSVPTIEGFTADWTASGESGVNGYILYIYNATTGAEVKVLNIPGQATDQAIITGLDPNTQYYAKIKVQGNGSTTTDSDLSPVSNTVTTLKARVATACISEDFSILTDVGSCPTGPGTSVRSSSGCAEYWLNLAGGEWHCESIRLNTNGYSGNTIYLYPYNSGTPTLTLPAVDMPMEISFYVKAESSDDAKYLDRGIKVSQNGVAVTTGITVDGVALTENSNTTSTADKTAPQLRPGGIIQVGSDSYHLIKVELDPSMNGSIIKVEAPGSKKYLLDNLTVKCDPMDLTITPDLDGLSYVKDLGPSDPQDITVSGNNLPVESGTATLSGVDEFEVSLDNGVTWTSGGSVNIPFTGGSFARTIKVRLPKDRNIGTYSDVFTLSATGYTKPSPSVTVEGEVTLFPIVLNCGQAVDVLRLMSPGLDQDHPSFMDLAAEKNWTTSGTVESNKNALGAYAFKLNKSGLQSPSINANNYDFLRLSFDAQPSSASGENKLLVQVYGTTGYIYNEEILLPEKQIYHQTIDLQSSVTMGNYSVIISSPKQTFYVTNIVLEGTAKRKFNFEAESLDDFQSYPDCPSDVKEITVYGTCLDDNKSLDFTSYKNFGNEKYEFSANGTDGWSSALSIPYTGEFPLRGMKVYVRQKQGLEAGSVNDVILVQNGGRGSAFISLSGQATAAGTWYPADGAVYNFSSVSGEAAEFAIPFSGGPFCAAPTVTTSCPGVTVSNCKGGAYASTTSFPATVTEGMIYVKYTPGTLTNCNIAVTAAGETHNVKVNWTGGAAVTTGVELAASSLKVPSAGVATVQSTAKGADMNAQVTITSDKFDVSMGNPAYGDFSAITTTKLDNMTGTLYIRPKAGATGSGTITFATDGGSDVVLNCTIE